MNIARTLLALPVIAVLAACQPSPEVPAAPGEATAGHTSGGEAADDAHAGHASELPPPPAQPWASDAPLRAGMEDIAKAVADAAQVQAAGSFDAAAAQALAAAVEDRFRYMLANCKLEPEADVVLHALLAQLVAGADAARADPDSEAGVPHMQQVLASYPQYFDHPGWQAAQLAD